jgi:hypothetical protein
VREKKEGNERERWVTVSGTHEIHKEEGEVEMKQQRQQPVKDGKSTALHTSSVGLFRYVEGVAKQLEWSI